jgi:hypothetical protein
MRTVPVFTVICLLLLVACSQAEPDDASLVPTAAPTESALTELTATPAQPTLAPTAEVPSATSEVAASTPIVVTAVSGATSLPLSQITPAPLPTQIPPTPIPSLSSGAGPTTLKYLLLESYPDLFYCDPDEYPVARGDIEQLARERFPQIQANDEEFQAILDHLGLSGQTTFTSDEQQRIYQEHKRLAAIRFDLVDDAYRFQFQVQEQGDMGRTLIGDIDGQGQITILDQVLGTAMCPICLAFGTQIDTPLGPVAVEALLPGDIVWTVDANGARVAAPLLRTTRTLVPATHRVVHLLLDDGRELWASPGHPTADGRVLGDLSLGDALDGGRIVRIESVPYSGAATYDLLPAGATGAYWADGILLGSTLAGR